MMDTSYGQGYGKVRYVVDKPLASLMPSTQHSDIPRVNYLTCETHAGVSNTAFS